MFSFIFRLNYINRFPTDTKIFIGQFRYGNGKKILWYLHNF